MKDEIPSLSIKTNLGLESTGSQFKKADKSGAKIALVIGEEELKDKKITFKDIRSKWTKSYELWSNFSGMRWKKVLLYTNKSQVIVFTSPVIIF